MNVRRLVESAQALLPPARGGVVVLAYHLVGGGTGSPVDLPLDRFRQQLGWLAAHCDVRSLRDFWKHPPRGERPAVALTFDDAYRNFSDVVWPLLRDASLPATLYVPVQFVEGTGPAPIRGTDLPPMTWSDLRRLSLEGLDVGSHTVSHVNLTRATEEVALREIAESRRILEDRLGKAVATFCYPQGKWNSKVAKLAERHYELSVIGGGRRAHPTSTPRAAVPRFPIRRDLASFEHLMYSRIWLSEAVADRIRQWRP